MSVNLARYQFTVAEFHRMADAGVFSEHDRVELIDGEVIEMTPIGSRHAACVNRLNRLLSTQVGNDLIVSVQNPLLLDGRTEVQPDLAVLRFRQDFYAESHPTPDDVSLVIEVSDLSLLYDKGIKARLYARSGVPELWVVDLSGGTLEAMWEPSGGTFSHSRILGRDDAAEPTRLPGITVRVSDVLGTGA